jgi:hypothetical protein
MSQSTLQFYKSLWEELTPSSLISHIIKGIITFMDRDDFVYGMHTFGDNASSNYAFYYGGKDAKHESICVGCIATSTIFKIMGVDPNPDNIWLENHPTKDYTSESVRNVEYAVNTLRSYNIRTYLTYFSNAKDIGLSDESISDIHEECLGSLGGRYSLNTIKGHPTKDQLLTYIQHLKQIQFILINHNL